MDLRGILSLSFVVSWRVVSHGCRRTLQSRRRVDALFLQGLCARFCGVFLDRHMTSAGF